MPGMRERGFGRVLNVASAGVREPIPNLMLSNAHRISMVNAFKTLARQVAADGVTLNTVLPGRIDTDRLAELFGSREAAAELAAETVPAGRLGSVEEFAAVSVFLCSARASYVTGETVAIDGGMLALGVLSRRDAAHLDCVARPHGLVVRTPPFQGGDRGFESRWGYRGGGGSCPTKIPMRGPPVEDRRGSCGRGCSGSRSQRSAPRSRTSRPAASPTASAARGTR